MAESASNDDLKNEIERLTKDVKSSQRDLRDLTSGIRLAQEAFSQYEQAQTQMTSAINQLKSPLLSSIATLIKDHKVANQRITLEEQKLVMLKQEQTVLARQKDLKLAEIKATEQRIKSERLATESKIQAIKNDIADGRGGANTAKIPEIDQLQSKKLETSTEIGTLGVYLNDLKTKGAEKLAGSEFIGDEFRSALGEANKEVGGNLILAAMLKEVTLIRKVVEGRISFEKKAGMSGGYRDTRTGQFVSEAKAGESGALSSAKTALAEEVRLSEIERVTKELEDQANTLESLTNQQKQLRDSTLAEAQQALEDHTKAVNDLEEAEIDFKDSTLKKLQKTLDEQKESSDDLTKKQQNLADKVKMQEASITSAKWQKLSKTLGNVAEVLNKAIGPILELQKQFGIAAGTAAKLKFGNLKASIESTINSLRGGGRSVSTAEIEAAQTSFQGEFGGVLTPEAARGIAEEAKTLGVSAGELAKARRVFMTQTMGDTGKAKAAQDKFIGEFAKKGLTSKDAMEAIGKYSELLARNGSRFSTSFARAAADAKKIGVDLAKVDQVGDNIIGNFEGFLESQAELGAMGFNLDSMKLAQIAETGDTGALFNELRSQLAMTGKDITKLKRSEQLALSEAFGLSMEDMQRMAGPTAGSGEETLSPEQLQKDANSLLTDVVSRLEGLIGVIKVVSSVVAGIKGLMALRAARSGGTGLLSSILGRGTRGTPGAPDAPTPSTGPTLPGGAGKGMFGNLNTTAMLKGAAAMLLMSGALFVFAKAAQEFMKTDWDSMGKAVVALGALTLAAMIIDKAKGQMIGGAVAMLVMGGALWVVGKAVQQFTGLKWETLAMAGVALVGLGLATAALGFFAPIIFIGSAALAAMGLALGVFSLAASKAAPVLESFGPVVTAIGAAIRSAFEGVASVITSIANGFVTIFNSLKELSAGQLLAAAAALPILAGGLLALGAVVIPFPERFLRGIAGALTTLGTAKPGALKDFTSALTELNGVVKSFDAGKLKEIMAATRPSLGQMAASAISGAAAGAGNVIRGIAGRIRNAFGGGTPATPAAPGAPVATETPTSGTPTTPPPAAGGTVVNVDLSRLEAKLDGVIRAIGSMKVEMDGNSVGRVLASNESRVSTYGPIRAQRA